MFFRRDQADWRAIGELVRLPNLPTAAADSAAGAMIVFADRSGNGMAAAILACSASVLLYAGGSALNDVCDAREDYRHRPYRPVPSGRVSLPMARLIAAELLLLGSTAAWFAAFFAGTLWPGMVALAIIAAVCAYNLRLKRTPFGPIAMGLCRFLNLLLGASVGAAFTPMIWLTASAIGVYTVGIAWFARTEEKITHRGSLIGATVMLIGGPAILAVLPWVDAPLIPTLAAEPGRWVLLMVILGALITWRCIRAISDPRPMMVQVTVAYAIMTLVVLDAAAVFAVRDVMGAIAVLALLVPAVALGSVFRST